MAAVPIDGTHCPAFSKANTEALDGLSLKEEKHRVSGHEGGPALRKSGKGFDGGCTHALA